MRTLFQLNHVNSIKSLAVRTISSLAVQCEIPKQGHQEPSLVTVSIPVYPCKKGFELCAQKVEPLLSRGLSLSLVLVRANLRIEVHSTDTYF